MAKRIYNQTALFGPLYAYLVVISPPDQVKRQLADLKQKLDSISDIGYRNRRSIPHITLIEKLTDDVIFPETVKQLLHQQHPFTFKLSAFKAFDHGHSTSLVIPVDNPEPIIALTQLLKGNGKSPNISIAKRLAPETTQLLLPELSDDVFEAEWLCTEVIVLRKLMSAKHLGWNEKFVIPLGQD